MFSSPEANTPKFLRVDRLVAKQTSFLSGLLISHHLEIIRFWAAGVLKDYGKRIRKLSFKGLWLFYLFEYKTRF